MSLFLTRVMTRFMGLLFLLGGVAMGMGIWQNHLRDRPILRADQWATGTVSSKDTRGSEVSEDPDYVLRYHFTLPDGTQRHEEQAVSERMWKRLNEGDPLQVLYSEKHPGRSFPEGSGATGLVLTLFVTLVAGLFGLTGLTGLTARVTRVPVDSGED